MTGRARKVLRIGVIAVLLIGLAAGGGFLALRATGIGLPKPAPSGTGPGTGKEDHDEGRKVKLTDAQVAAAGIEVLTSADGTIRQTLRLNGMIQTNQEAQTQVTPRFPGVIRDVRKRLGDQVAAGDVLATIESNQSLTIYELKAPMAGTVIERSASRGEYASEQKPVFVIADLSTVWVDLSVYRRDFERVRVGDTVLIDMEGDAKPVETRISYVSPIGSSDTQTALARAVAANDSRLRPGLFVTARLILSAKKVDLAIKLSALQVVDGKTVVFVRNGDKFETREVELGARDDDMVEVLFGLLPGDLYAAKNSFVVKAEMAKGSASHEH